LQKIAGAAHRIPNMPAERNPASAHLFIVNPLSGARMDNLFSTHPNVENRIARLDEIAARMGQGAGVEPLEPAARASGPWASPQQGGWRRRGPWDQT
jgi:heat shock protein HtpX